MLVHTLGRGVEDAALILMAAVLVAGIFSAGVAGLSFALPQHARAEPFLRVWLEIFFVSAAFGVIGVTSGFLTGISRSPAVSALVPAVLTVFGALVAYLMSKGAAQALLAAIAVVTFSATLLLGTISGSLMRQDADENENSIAKGYREAERDLAVQSYRKSLGLPPEVKEVRKKSDQDGK